MKRHFKLLILLFIMISSMSLSAEGSGIFLEVMTDDATIKFQEEEFEANGGILFQYEDIKIKAFKIKKVKEKNVVIAYEKVIFQQGDKTVECDEVEVNLDTKEAVIKNGGTVMDNIFYGGQIFQAKFPDIAVVRNAGFTTCNKVDPHYHFVAKKIEFYPGRKIIAYNTFLYIGNQKVMWLPFYVSSVKTDGQRATLFPKFGSDEEKGMYVIWGLEYDFNKYMKGYMDLQYSKKKGYYINTWSNDYEVNKENNGNLTLKEYRITTNSDKKEWDFVWSHKTDSPGAKRKYIKESKWNFYISDKTTNLLKDSDGNQIPITETTSKRSTLRKYEFDGSQKLFDDMTLTTAVKWTDSDIIKQVIAAEDETTNGDDSGIASSETDNEIYKKITLSKDNALYGISGSYENTQDLDPGRKGDYYSYKDNRGASLQLKKYKVNLSYLDTNGDTYQSKTGDAYTTIPDYKYKIDKNYTLTLGDYKILNSDFYYGGSYKAVEKNYYRYNYKDLSTGELAANPKDEDDSIESKYSEITGKFGNSAIPLWIAGKMNLSYEYGKRQFAETKNAAGETEGGEELDNHRVSSALTTDIFDNSKNEAGSFDLVIKNEIPFTYSFAKGEAPKTESEILSKKGSSQFPDRVINIGDTVYFNLGNTTNSYTTTYEKRYYGEKDLDKSDYLSGNLKLAVLDESININANNTKSYYEGLYTGAEYRNYDKKGNKKDDSFNSGLEYRKGGKTWSFNRTESKGYTEATSIKDSENIVNTFKFSTKNTSVTYKNTKYMTGTETNGVFSKSTDKDLDYFGISHSNVKELLKKTVEATYEQGNNKGTSSPGKTDGVLSLKMRYEDTSGNKKIEEKKAEDKKIENKNFALSEEEVKKALEILDKEKQSGKFDLKGLGREKEMQTLDMSKVYELTLSLTSDRQYLDKKGFGFSNYEKSLKNTQMRYTIKYTTWFNWTGGISLERDEGGASLETKKYDSELQLQLGQTGKEKLIWWIGYDTNYTDSYNGEKVGKFTNQKIYLKKQVTDCTTLEVNYKRTLDDITSDDYDTSYGIAFSINAFPEKGLELNYENEKIGFGAGM